MGWRDQAEEDRSWWLDTVITDTMVMHADERGWTPLHYAAQAGAAGACCSLLRQGASTTARGARGEVPADLTKDPMIKQILAEPHPRHPDGLGVACDFPPLRHDPFPHPPLRTAPVSGRKVRKTQYQK